MHGEYASLEKCGKTIFKMSAQNENKVSLQKIFQKMFDLGMPNHGLHKTVILIILITTAF